MSPNPLTLSAGRATASIGSVSPATVRIIPTVAAVPGTWTAPAAQSRGTVPDQAERAATRPASPAAAYFGLFRSCGCGHSSAWHNGAFGDAWRAGQQVHGRCEASADGGSAAMCGCAHFRDSAQAG